MTEMALTHASLISFKAGGELTVHAAVVLSSCGVIRQLDLDLEPLNVAALTKLSASVGQLSGHQQLRLRHVSSAGYQAIGAVLPKPTHLSDLRIDTFGTLVMTTKHDADNIRGLLSLPSLQRLVLAGSSIEFVTDHAANAFCSGLQESTSLEYLIIICSTMTMPVHLETKLAKALARSKQIELVYQPHVTDAFLQAFVTALTAASNS